MKRKPDMLVTLILVFCLGLVVSGLLSYEWKEERSGMHLTMIESDQSREGATALR